MKKRNQLKSKGLIIGGGVVILAAVLIVVLVGLLGLPGSTTGLKLLKKGSAEAVNKEGDRKNTLIVYADGVTGSVNPFYAQGSGDEAVSRIIFEPLMVQDEDGVYQPYLARSLNVSEDGLTYTIQLKEHVLFSDGSEMTAQDVIASIASMGLSEYTGSAAEAYSNIVGFSEFAANPAQLPSGLTSDGDYTVKVQFLTVSPDNLQILGTRIQKDLFTSSEDADGDGTWDSLNPNEGIGTGAYQLTDTTTESLATLIANPAYRESIGDIQQIEFKSVSYYDTQTEVEDSGLDVVLYGGGSLLYDTFYGWDGYSVYEETENTVYTLFYNQENAALTNQKVRQAIACSFNREGVSEQLQSNMLTMESGIGPNMKGTEVPEKYSYSVSKAKKLLKEAEEEQPDLSYGISLKLPILKDSEYHAVLAQEIKTDLEAIGIQVEVEELDQQEYMRALYLTMDFDLYLAGLSITDSIDSYQNLYQLSGMPVSVEDEGITEAYAALAASATQEQVSQNGKALYDAIEEAQPSLILGRSRSYLSVSADLSGYNTDSYEDFLGEIYKIRVK
jgi:peptide/nickel transport system substrate-binding protein